MKTQISDVEVNIFYLFILRFSNYALFILPFCIFDVTFMSTTLQHFKNVQKSRKYFLEKLMEFKIKRKKKKTIILYL